jgi:hypothetical protein
MDLNLAIQINFIVDNTNYSDGRKWILAALAQNGSTVISSFPCMPGLCYYQSLWSAGNKILPCLGDADLQRSLYLQISAKHQVAITSFSHYLQSPHNGLKYSILLLPPNGSVSAHSLPITFYR